MMPQGVEARQLHNHYRSIRTKLRGKPRRIIPIINLDRRVCVRVTVIKQEIEIPVLPPPPTIYPSMDVILATVAEYYDVDRALIRSSGKDGWIVRARHMAMYLCRTCGKQSYPKTAKFMKRKDHTTARNSFQKIDAATKTDANIAIEVAELTTRLSQVTA